MISRLDKYLFSQSLRPTMLITFCVLAVVWLTQVLQKVDIMVKDGGSFVSFTKITFLILPSLVAEIMPFTVFAGVLFLLNQSASDSETTVMFSGGASRSRIARPLLFLGLIGAILTAYINLDLMPRSQTAFKDEVYKIRNDIAKSLIREGQFRTLADGLMISAEQVLPGGQYRGLFIHDFRNPDESVTHMAESGLYMIHPSGARLHLANGNSQFKAHATGQVNIIQFQETSIALSRYQSTSQRFKEPSEMYLSELFNPPAYLNPEKADEARATGHARIASPLYNILFVLIAACFMLRGEVQRNGYGGQMFRAISLAILFKVLSFVVQFQVAGQLALYPLIYILPIGAIFGFFIWLIWRPRFGLHQRQSITINKDFFHAADQEGEIENEVTS